jgi:hypothetical protein
MSMNWDWSNEVEYLNEKLPPDNLDRAKYAKFLYEVAARRGETSNLVININAEWGAGKTHFTRRLAQTIKEKHPTVYVDAWKQDFSDDPLLAIFSSISEQLGDQSDKFITLVKKTEKKVGVLLKGIAPAIIQGIVKKTTGIDDLSEIAKSVTENVIELHKEKSAVIEEIKKDLAEWVRFIKQKDAINKELPIFIFIDELDRCRPSYAINLLEIVKHIFDVKGLVFFISTDTDQLQHSIKVIYGQDFDAQQYLGRFFDRRNVLGSPKIKELLEVRTPENIRNDYLSLSKHLIPQPIYFQDFTETLSDIFNAFQINIRDSLKYFERLCDIILVTNKNFDPIFTVLIMCLFDNEQSLYKDLKDSRITNIDNKKLDTYNKKTRNSLYKSFYLHIDISPNKTGVLNLGSLDEYNSLRFLSNQHSKLKLNKTLADYLNGALKKIKEPYNETTNNINIRLEERNAPFPSTRAIENADTYIFLTILWNNIKGSSSELKFHEYFDLVELSTTLD